MRDDSNRTSRVYRSPQREAAAQRTRESIVRAAKELFEQQGWAATTVRAVAVNSGISQKSVEAIYKTKAGLLQATIDYAMRGDTSPTPMPQRPALLEMESVGDAKTMLQLHAAHLRRVVPRSAGIAWAVEQAAATGGQPAELWAQMHHNRTYAVRWAAKTLLSKPDTRHLTKEAAETVFWIAIDWATYRTLSAYAGLNDKQYETWLRTYYDQTLLSS